MAENEENTRIVFGTQIVYNAKIGGKNKLLLQQRLQEKKQGIRQFKVGKKTADKYYKNMIKMQTGASYFFDKEK